MAEPNDERQRRVSLITFLVFFAATVLFALVMVQPFLLSLFMGGLLALLFSPVWRRLRARGLGPKLSSAITTLGMIVLVIGPFSTFTTLAVRQGVVVGQRLVSEQGGREPLSIDSVIGRLAKFDLVKQLIGSPEELEKKARAAAQTVASRATALVVSLAAALPDLGLQLLLACIACFFLLIDGKRLMSWLGGLVPLDRDVRGRLDQVFRDMAISTIWATLAAAAAQSTVMVTAYLVLGVPAAALACGATFLFSWIPLVGATPIWGAGMIYLYAQGETGRMLAMLGFGLLASVVDNFVRPLVLKGRGELHPLVALVSIFGGVRMFGLLGAFIGPIVASVLIALLKLWPVVGRRDGIRVEGGPGPAKKQPAA